MDATVILFAFGLTFLAGISTGIGGVLSFFCDKSNMKFLSVVLGFSAGVMIYISFVELFSEAKDYLGIYFNDNFIGSCVCVIFFFMGMFLTALIDKIILLSHDFGEINIDKASIKNKKLLRTGLFTAIVIIIHNFPEGIATLISTVKDPSLGILIAVAIAIHNIPEGISVAMPVYCSTGSRKKSLLLAVASGLTEPLGAIIGYLILLPFLNDFIFGIIFALIAGIMVYISLDELLPLAQEYGKRHLPIYGLILGMMVIAISLLIL